MNLPHIKEKNTHYNNNPLAPRLVKIKVRENLYNIKMKEINTKVRKNKRGNLYKMKRNLQSKIAYQTESLNPKELSG